LLKFLDQIQLRTQLDTNPVELPLTGDQFFKGAANYTTHNKHKRRKSMLSAGFKPAIPAIERPLIYALGSTATGFDLTTFQTPIFKVIIIIITNYLTNNGLRHRPLHPS